MKGQSTALLERCSDQLFSQSLSESASRSLLKWWQRHGRCDPLQKPWMFRADGQWPAADEGLDPYPIWVAEVMLQQTQLQVVLPYWKRWMEAFPGLETLARAPEHQVLLLWQGLGYYSRARRLHATSRLLLAQLESNAGASCDLRQLRHWPVDPDIWLALPGIGRSTAGGILSSAFNSPLAILDGNVRRVLARLHAHPHPPMRAQAQFWTWSENLIDAVPGLSRNLNQALMDLGATVCTPRHPSCEVCPWDALCAAYASGSPQQYPVKEAPREIPFQVIGVGIVLNAAGEVLIDQRLNEGLLGGMWEFPGGKQEPGEPIRDTISRELREELAIEVSVEQELVQVDHAYSHKKLRFEVHLCRWVSGDPQPLASQQVRWVKPSELSDYPFPAANARIITALLKHLN